MAPVLLDERRFCDLLQQCYLCAFDQSKKKKRLFSDDRYSREKSLDLICMLHAAIHETLNLRLDRRVGHTANVASHSLLCRPQTRAHNARVGPRLCRDVKNNDFKSSARNVRGWGAAHSRCPPPCMVTFLTCSSVYAWSSRDRSYLIVLDRDSSWSSPPLQYGILFRILCQPNQLDDNCRRFIRIGTDCLHLFLL